MEDILSEELERNKLFVSNTIVPGEISEPELPSPVGGGASASFMLELEQTSAPPGVRFRERKLNAFERLTPYDFLNTEPEQNEYGTAFDCSLRRKAVLNAVQQAGPGKPSSEVVVRSRAATDAEKERAAGASAAKLSKVPASSSSGSGPLPLLAKEFDAEAFKRTLQSLDLGALGEMAGPLG
ncbi:unnamed protein product, partial [Urochloa humidicola]